MIGGVTRGGFPWWLINQDPSKKILVVTSEEEDVPSLVDDAKALLKHPQAPRSPSFRSFPVVAYTIDDEPGRQVSLYQWLFDKAKILVCSLEGMELNCDSAPTFRHKGFLMRPGLTIKRKELEERWALASYSRNDHLDQVGEYCIRGDVIDIWPAGEPAPIRMTWNFDTLESLRVIDLFTQRSEAYRTEVLLYPVLSGSGSNLLKEISLDKKIIAFLGQMDPASLPAQLTQLNPELVTSTVTAGQNEGFEAPPVFGGNIPALKEQLIKWHDDDWDVVIFCHNEGERDRLDELLADPIFAAKGQRAPWVPPLIIGELEHGFLRPSYRQAVLANSEIFGRYRKRVRLPKFEGGQTLVSPLDIQPHDYLVHEKHGIGRYVGLKSLKIAKVTSEFLQIEYRGGDKLYVPIFELQQVQKYLGAEGRRPGLSSLDTSSWERLKSKVKEDVAKLAQELLSQAAKRVVRLGHAFPPQTKLEQEFGNSFRYELTNDQKKSLEEVEKNMVSSKAMDRLICGDVGYGKTEIAMRAALKAALAGKQVCVLCPTTILAEQHHRNFEERLADYPVTCMLLSRFQGPSEQKKVVEAMVSGGADIIIGTHRLLSSDVSFKDLGLLIIDEEHRFGVKQKNKILQIRDTADVLSMTATPIPRTLASALGGIKDLSIIETAPPGRLPISTHVGLFDEDLVGKAIQDEMDRSGQVFYVHNHVKTLFARKEWLQTLLPHIRIGVAHGQMKEEGLEIAMYDFLHRKIDVLLATTIIESGLDIPSVNTLIVEEAQDMGLAQLYQLRGRVGRSTRRAFCYLFYGKTGMTTEAKKRLEALKEHTALGSGFRLAMRDMEIRGAGNLLGSQQHGNIAAVGLETYSQLLQDEIQRWKGEEALSEESFSPVMEISLSTYLPDDYLPSEQERIGMYKRILNANEIDLAKLKDELEDRCGPLPESGKNLFEAASLRLLLKKHGIAEVHQDEGSLRIYFRPNTQLANESYEKLISHSQNIWNFIPGDAPGVQIPIKGNEKILDIIRSFLRTIFPQKPYEKICN